MTQLLKSAGCEHQHKTEALCQPAFLNTYLCDSCGEEWDDVWSAMCDDECPKCHREYSPVDSEEIAPCACKEINGRPKGFPMLRIGRAEVSRGLSEQMEQYAEYA